MYNIFVLIESCTNGYSAELLDLISLLATLSAIFVIITKNPIISVLFLISLFLSISIYLMMLGINFIGLSYLLVYVGAVSILFIFILMLINIRISEIVNDNTNSLTLGIVLSILFYSFIYEVLPYNQDFFNNLKKLSLFENKIFYVTSNAWDSNLAENSHITSIGNVIYTSYFLWLIITSIILLLAMVGAIVITIKPKYSLNN